MYILRTEKQGGGKLMFRPFEIVYMCMALVLFQKHVVLQLIHNYINSMLGLHITDECLEQFFICFLPFLEC